MAFSMTSKPISDLPADQKIRIWNIVTNTISEIPKVRYNMLMREAVKAKEKGLKVYPDWAKKNYAIDLFQGTKRKIYHWKKDQWLDFMTMELFDEIMLRNPKDPNNKDDFGNPIEYWKGFLSTTKDVLQAIESQKTPQDIQNEALQKQIDELKALLKSGQSFNPSQEEVKKEAKPEPIEPVWIKQTPDSEINNTQEYIEPEPFTESKTELGITSKITTKEKRPQTENNLTKYGRKYKKMV